MDKELADKIFRLTVEAQKIENEKFEIRKMFKGRYGEMLSWDFVCTQAMKFTMEEAHAN